MWNLNYDTDELIFKAETDSWIYVEKRQVVARGRSVWRWVGVGGWC